ncbi:hypothetical protein [Paraburkholderia fungorum]|uniref:hypothetical protein n=1 Tax=Paraburkholderia fungorum TaxID=134537 RepID=UPI0011C3EAE4|nr:hypothetical protein [Paraburkholderia fungorum]
MISLGVAVAREHAAGIAHVAIWRIFIVLLFPDFLLLGVRGAECRIFTIHHNIVKKPDGGQFADPKALKLQRIVIRRGEP